MISYKITYHPIPKDIPCTPNVYSGWVLVADNYPKCPFSGTTVFEKRKDVMS